MAVAALCEGGRCREVKVRVNVRTVHRGKKVSVEERGLLVEAGL